MKYINDHIFLKIRNYSDIELFYIAWDTERYTLVLKSTAFIFRLGLLEGMFWLDS